jgi:hypothetical protein
MDELPRAVRILPSRLALRGGLAAGLMLCSGLILLGAPHGGREPGLALIGYWAGLAAGAAAALGCAVGLVLQLPVIEATELGIAVWLEGPYRRPFFAPWSHVRSIVLRADPTGRRALGIELNADAAHADLAWPTRSISGDARRWVETLTLMKKTYSAATV